MWSKTAGSFLSSLHPSLDQLSHPTHAHTATRSLPILHVVRLFGAPTPGFSTVYVHWDWWNDLRCCWKAAFWVFMRYATFSESSSRMRVCCSWVCCTRLRIVNVSLPCKNVNPCEIVAPAMTTTSGWRCVSVKNTLDLSKRYSPRTFVTYRSVGVLKNDCLRLKQCWRAF